MTEKDQITCKDTTWLVSDSCERELSEKEVTNLHHHIATCELCQGASKQFEVMFRQIDLYLGREKSDQQDSD